ncbi:MAG: carboxypeptidase-like regulatory domain-containing protein, partial [Candidatus Fermentibacteraceae bacterium]|nr:carboxypeptidase-like regulatory domain-containing protein [Candidatus Fermentibacteraceae bacterium]
MFFSSRFFLVMPVLVFLPVAFAVEPVGSIAGEVVSDRSQDPVIGAYVMIDGTSYGGMTDASGAFSIEDVPVGGYSLRVSSVGHHPEMKTDVMVRSGRVTFLEFSLAMAVISGGGIEVRPSYFTEDETNPTSSIDLAGEQIRRTPGSAGDVTRVIAGLPSISKVDDQYNGLAVRGGNPIENGFYIDNIEIANINHFPRQGTSGGGVGMVNVDLLEDVWFSAGGFSSAYGDRLSSVMELKLRGGNREEFDGQLDFSMSGFGSVLEGPLDYGRGSWLVCARRSFIDLLIE